MQYEQLGNQIVSALTGAPAPTYGNTMNQGYPQQGSMMNQGYGASMAQESTGDSWVCSCGARNTGIFCEYCGAPKP